MERPGLFNKGQYALFASVCRDQAIHDRKEKRYVLNTFFRCEFNVQIFLQGLIVQSALLHCEVENPKNKTPLQKGNTNICPFLAVCEHEQRS